MNIFLHNNLNPKTRTRNKVPYAIGSKIFFKRSRYFHPPSPKKLCTFQILHDVQGKPEESLFPDHRNLKHNFLIFSIIPTAIQKCIQYIGIASRTNLINVILPPLVNHLKLQFIILFSTSAINQSQSFIRYLQSLDRSLDTSNQSQV